MRKNGAFDISDNLVEAIFCGERDTPSQRGYIEVHKHIMYF